MARNALTEAPADAAAASATPATVPVEVPPAEPLLPASPATPPILQPTPTPPLAWVLLVVLAGIWGTSFILMKRGLVVFSALELGAARVAIACLCLLPFTVRELPRIGRPYFKWLLVSGVVGTLLPAFLFAYAETQLASGLAGVLNSLTALFVLLVGAALFGQRLTALRVAGILVGLAGTAVLILLGSGAAVSGSGSVYGLYIVLATVFYGISVNVVKHKLQALAPLGVSSVSLLLIGPLAAVFLLGFTDFTHKLATVPGAWSALGYIGLLAMFGTAVGLFLFNMLIRRSTALFASSSTYLIPVVALGWGVADGEAIHLMHYVGMLIILAGVTIVNRAR